MLDLSKLKALELPKKEITVEILGDEQNLEVQALDDETAIKIAAIASADISEDEKELRARREMLRGGVVGISDDDIDLLMKKAAAVVTKIMIEIRDLTAEYGKARNVTIGEVEKNSAPAVSDSVND